MRSISSAVLGLKGMGSAGCGAAARWPHCPRSVGPCLRDPCRCHPAWRAVRTGRVSWRGGQVAGRRSLVAWRRAQITGREACARDCQMERNLCYKTRPRACNASRLAPQSLRWHGVGPRIVAALRRRVRAGSHPTCPSGRLPIQGKGRGCGGASRSAGRWPRGAAGPPRRGPRQGRVRGRRPVAACRCRERSSIPPAGLNCRQGARGLHRGAAGGARTLQGQSTTRSFHR
jgi:hypothetical protein